MLRRFAIVLAALALAISAAHASSGSPADNDWSNDDKILEDGGDRLMNESQYHAAETLYRHVLDLHPHSPTALIHHVKALNALGRHEEALREAQEAVELEPDDVAANDSLGIAQASAHHYRDAKLMRLAVPLLLLPLFTATLWSSVNILIALAGSYVLFLFGAMILRKRARRMEERADTFGKEAESEAGIYPLALAKLYESNLIPAVMPGKKKVHPHLYDRLLAAGITPDYPRPKPPGRWGGIAGLLVVVLEVIALGAIWLALF